MLAVAICCCGFAAAVPDDGVKKALTAFDAAPSQSTATAFFSALRDADFIDDNSGLPADISLDRLKANVWYWAGEWYYNEQEYDEAEQYLLKALPLVSTPTMEADCLSLLAIVYTRQADYNTAAVYAKRCFELDLASGDPDVISSSLNTLAAIYLSAKQPQEAEQYVIRGIDMARHSGNKARLAVLLATASEVFHALDKNELALKCINEAYDIDIALNLGSRAHIRLAQKASVLTGMKQYAEAEMILAQVIPLLRADNNRQSLGIACNEMGRVLFEQSRLDEAALYYREAANIFALLGDLANEARARRGLYESLWRTDPADAKVAFDRFNVIKDSIYSTASAESLARYNAEFGNDWLLLENHDEHRAKMWAIAIAVAIAALGALVWWLMYRRNRRQKAINRQLSSDIDELQAKYVRLNEQYDEAIAGVRDLAERELQPADRDFIEKMVKEANDLIGSGNIDAAMLAQHLALSPFQLRQRLAQLLDETPQAFIQIIRMQRACYLLRNQPQLSVAEVAQMCAYADTSNFTRAFKRDVGVSPSRYAQLRP